MKLTHVPRYLKELFTGELRHRLVRKYSRDRGKVFSSIYDSGVWLRSQGESRSGEGSTVEITTNVRTVLEQVVAERGIKTFLDAPCGDFNWMRLVHLPHVNYTGADIVPSVVRRNQQEHTAPSRSFIQLDLCTQLPPANDLVLCRDCIQHLANPEVKSLLRNISRSGSRFLLVTTTPAMAPNSEIVRTGDFRPINLEAAPWSIPQVEARYVDYETPDPLWQKHLLLIRLPLPNAWFDSLRF